MIQAKSILYLYVESSLHAGSGKGLGAVDLPIQRERVTGYPIIQSSGVKGRLRAETDPHTDINPFPPEPKLSEDEWVTIFGPETSQASEHAGALSVGDARLLLFPVRSLSGVFAWTTSIDALARFQRDALAMGVSLGESKPGACDAFILPEKEPDPEKTLVGESCSLLVGENVVLEEFSFGSDDSQKTSMNSLAKWLVNNVIPTGDVYRYWRENLPQKFCLLPENAFRDFTLYATEVQTHIKIEPDTKTVKSGALWTTESLPVDTVMYVPLMATPPRKLEASLKDASAILGKVTSLQLTRMHMGGDETTGQGMVALRFGR